MFGPNVKTAIHGPYMHHREQRFRNMLKELNEQCQRAFDLPDYEFLFVTGSGTMANEIVISSFGTRWRVLYDDAKFGKMLADMNEAHHPKHTQRPFKPQGLAYVRYETSISQQNKVANQEKPDEIVFADCVSSFPFYPIDGADIFTTVSSKQIGAYPIISIIGYIKSLRIEYFLRTAGVLDLGGYIDAAATNQTPHTPAIPLYQNLLDILRTFDLDQFRSGLQERIHKFSHLTIIQEHRIGTGPVITLSDKMPGLEDLVAKWNLYRSPAGYQIFLWSGTDWQVDELYRDFKRIRK